MPNNGEPTLAAILLWLRLGGNQRRLVWWALGAHWSVCAVPRELPRPALLQNTTMGQPPTLKKGNSPLGGGTVDDTVLFGPWPTCGNIGHRRGCGSRCRAFGEMINRSCSQGSAPAYRFKQRKTKKKHQTATGTVHEQKACWYRCPEGLSSPVPHGNQVSPLCCRGLR